MKIKVLDTEEQEDGGLTMNVECDHEFVEKAVEFYVIHMLEKAIEESKSE